MAFKNLASLVAKLEVQSAQWHAELEKANRKLDKFSRDANVSLKSIDKMARNVAKGLKAFGAGALAFKVVSVAASGASKAIENLAKTDTQFAATMKQTQAAYQNLWKAGSQAAAAQERLNIALKDPQILGATQRFADGLSAGYIDMKRRILEALASAQQFDRWLGTRIGVYDKGSFGKQDFAGLVASKMPAATEAQRQKDAAAGPNPYMKLVRDAGVREARDAAEQSAAALKKAEDAARQAADALIDFNAARWDNMNVSLNTRAQELLKDFQLETFDIEGQLEHLSQSGQKAFDEMSVYADQAARNMQDAFADFLFDPFDKGVKGMLKGFIDVIRRMIAEQAAANLFGGGIGKLLSGAVGGLFGGGAAASAGGTFSGPRAAGGPVDAGYSYLVGERGPELFTPRSGGHITPNHALGGGVVQNITVDARGATVDAIRAIPAAMAEAKRQAVAEVQELVRRGRL